MSELKVKKTSLISNLDNTQLQSYNDVIYIEDGSWVTSGPDKSQYFIRLGAFLKYIKEGDSDNNTGGLLIYNGNTNLSLLDIDYNPNTNFMYNIEGQLSFDFTKCIIGGFATIINPSGVIFPNCTSFIDFVGDQKIRVGKIMNIYINFEFILNTLENLQSSEKRNKVDLFSFLVEICNGINDSLGNFNQLEPIIDEQNNTLKIIDNTQIPGQDFLNKHLQNKAPKGSNSNIENYAEDPTQFEVYGLGQNLTTGSFIKTFGIKTEITNELATMLTVGAQANGAVVGEDATAFSKWNTGLIDRIIPKKFDYYTQQIDAKQNNNPNERNEAISQFVDFEDKFKGRLNYLKDLANDLEEIDSDTKIMKSYIDAIQRFSSLSTSKPPSTTLGFIPINFNLTMDGLSGIKIFQKFSLDTRFLPSNYPDSLDFIIKGISHKVDTRWETSIESFSIPKNDLVIQPPPSNTPPKVSDTQSTTTVESPYKDVNVPSGDCNKDATIKLSTNYNLAQYSCQAIAAKYSVPSDGQKKFIGPLVLTRQMIIDNLTSLAVNVVEPIRSKFPSVLVTNAYRNKGGDSQHEKGEAVDLQFSDIGGVVSVQNDLIVKRAEEIKKILVGKKGFDQFLLEYKTDRGGRPWIHISFKKDGVGNRNEIRTFLDDKTAPQGNGKFYNPIV